MAKNLDADIIKGIETFAQYSKALNPKSVDMFTKQIELLAKKIPKEFNKITEAGRLTEEGFEKLNKQIEKTRAKGFTKEVVKSLQDELKTRKLIAEKTNKWSDALDNSIKSIGKFIPLVGEQISEAFSKKIIPKLQKRLDVLFTSMFTKGGKIFGGAGAGMSIAKMGVWGVILSAVVAIGKEFMRAEQMIADMVKNTGFLRSDLKGVRDGVVASYKNLVRFGISLDDIQDQASALVEEFGALSFINQEMIENVTKWSKVFNLGASEMAGFVDVMHRVMGNTNAEMDHFVRTLNKDARIAGVSVRMVMKDITNDANFLALYTDQTGKNIKEASIQARRMGVSLSVYDSLGQTFSDFESSIENSMKLNHIFGTQINAQLAFEKASLGDLQGLQNYLLENLVDQNKEWKDLTYLQRNEMSKALGVSLEQMAKMYQHEHALKNVKTTHLELLRSQVDTQGMTIRQQKDHYITLNRIAKQENLSLKQAEEKLNAEAKLEKILSDQQTVWMQVWNGLKEIFYPYIIRIGKYISDNIQPPLSRIMDAFGEGGLSKGFKQLMQEGSELVDFLGDLLAKAVDRAFKLIQNRYKISISNWLLGGDLFVRTKSLEETQAESVENSREQRQGKQMGNASKALKTYISGGTMPNYDSLYLKDAYDNMLDEFADDPVMLSKLSKAYDDILYKSHQYANKDVKGFAKGGIVTSPTRALIGEAGPEMIIPLGNKTSMNPLKMGGGAVVLNLEEAMAGIGNIGGSGLMKGAGSLGEIERRADNVKQVATMYRNRIIEEEKAEFNRQLKIENKMQKQRQDDYETFESGVNTFKSSSFGFAEKANSFIQELTGKSAGQLIAQGIGNMLGIENAGAMFAQGKGAYDAYKQGGFRGLASQAVGKGGILGEGGLLGNTGFAKNFGGLIGNYGKGGWKGALAGSLEEGGLVSNLFKSDDKGGFISNLFGMGKKKSGGASSLPTIDLGGLGSPRLDALTPSSDIINTLTPRSGLPLLDMSELDVTPQIRGSVDDFAGTINTQMEEVTEETPTMFSDFKKSFKGFGDSLSKTFGGIGKSFSGLGKSLGMGGIGKALGGMGLGSIGLGGAGALAGGVSSLLKGDFKGALGGIASGLIGSVPVVGGVFNALGGLGGIKNLFGGWGKGAKIESAWHPQLLEYLYSQGAKPGDKIPKDEIKKMNMQIFGSEKAPNTKDGFSKYDMKGAEEKADRLRSPQESLALSQQIFSGGAVGGLNSGSFGGGGIGGMMSQAQSMIASGATVQSTRAGFAEGGIAFSPMVANVAEKEPEIIAPFSKIPEIINEITNKTGGSGDAQLGAKIDNLTNAIMALANRPVQIKLDGKVIAENTLTYAEEFSRQ